MQQLHLVGFTTDLEGLIFSARRGAKSGGFVLDLDDRLLEVLDEALRLRSERDDEVADDAGDEADDDDGRSPRHPSKGVGRTTAITPRRAPRPESHLTPREIQSRLRAGRTIEEVASEAGVGDEWIARFAAPIQAEQRQVVGRARELTFAKARLGDSTQDLGTSVLWNLADKGVALTEDEYEDGWAAYHLRDTSWVVRFEYVSRRRTQTAEWEVDLRDGDLFSLNRLATELGYVERGRRKRRYAFAEPLPEAIIVVPESPPSSAKKGAAKKAAAKKAAAKKRATSRPAPKQPASKKRTGAKKPAAKKPAPKRTAPKKVGKRPAARKAARTTTGRAMSSAKKKSARKATGRATAARATSKRTPARKAAARKAVARKATKRGPDPRLAAVPARPIAITTSAVPAPSGRAGAASISTRPAPTTVAARRPSVVPLATSDAPPPGGRRPPPPPAPVGRRLEPPQPAADLVTAGDDEGYEPERDPAVRVIPAPVATPAPPARPDVVRIDTRSPAVVASADRRAAGDAEPAPRLRTRVRPARVATDPSPQPDPRTAATGTAPVRIRAERAVDGASSAPAEDAMPGEGGRRRRRPLRAR